MHCWWGHLFYLEIKLEKPSMLKTDNQIHLMAHHQYSNCNVWLWGIKKFFTDFFFSFGVNVCWNKTTHFSLLVINFLIIFKINRPSVNANVVVFNCIVSTFNSGNFRKNSMFWQISKGLLIYPYIFVQWLCSPFSFSPVSQLSASSTFFAPYYKIWRTIILPIDGKNNDRQIFRAPGQYICKLL